MTLDFNQIESLYRVMREKQADEVEINEASRFARLITFYRDDQGPAICDGVLTPAGDVRLSERVS